MTWIYCPGTSSASVVDMGGGSSDLDLWSRVLGPSAWWRGKHSSSSIWLKRCKKVFWVKRLSSLMLKHSTAIHGVEKWIASLEAIPDNRSLLRGDVLGPAIHVTYGQLSAESLMRSSPPTASLKTSTITSGWDMMKSMPTWEEWVISLRREYSARLKRGQAIYGNGSTSWPTPNLPNGGRKAKGLNLETEMDANGQKRQVGLENVAEAWSTPTASNTHGAGSGPGRLGGDNLQTQADSWNPPAEKWTTPYADDTGTRKKKCSQGGSLLSLQADQINLDGVEFLNAIQTSRPNCQWRLNPLFGHWLMRLPIGWIGCALSETELIQWCSRWRFRLFGIEYMETKI